MNKTKLSRSDEWYTPLEYVEFAKNRYRIDFQLDVCAKNKEASVCDNYISPKQDALSIDWSELCSKLGIKKNIWMNPPNSELSQFVTTSFRQWEDSHDMNLCCFIPTGSISRKWFVPIWNTIKVTDKIHFHPAIPRPKFFHESRKSENNKTGHNEYIYLIMEATLTE